MIDVSWTGGLIAFGAAWRLARPRRAIVMIAAAGALAGLWAVLLQGVGVPSVAAVPGAALVPIVSAYLSMRRPAFAPPSLREEATLAILVLAVAVGMSSTVAQEWRSALALNATDIVSSSAPVPTSMLTFVVASMVLGGLWTLRRRG